MMIWNFMLCSGNYSRVNISCECVRLGLHRDKACGADWQDT
jgi:hypothetical protein